MSMFSGHVKSTVKPVKKDGQSMAPRVTDTTKNGVTDEANNDVDVLTTYNG